MSKNAPERVGKYIVERQLGQGAMGVVYLCSQPIVGRKVAVKRVQSAALDKPELLERFLREAAAAGSLHHENIVVVHTVEEDDEGRPFIVMEYLDGQDLGEMLLEPDGLPRLRLRLEVAFQVASALEHAHQNKVVHRDVKPSNVIVLPGGRVKLVDFGIARIGGSKMTMDGSLMGTPQYMAPEQWQGKLADQRSDVYAFGILLYELAAGHVPYDSENPLAIGTKILDKSNPPLAVETLFDGSAPPEGINEIIASCTQREQTDRPDGFAPVRAALSKILAGLPEQDSFASMAVEQVQARIDAAREQLKLGQHKRAAANLRRARKEGAGDQAGITQLERQVDVVRLCAEAGDAIEEADFEAADRLVEQALAIDSSSEMAKRLLERVATVRSINKLVEEVRDARSMLDFTRVTDVCERILALEPEHGYALRLLGEATELRRSHELNERLEAVRSRASEGDLDGAIKDAKALAAEAPEFAAVGEVLAKLERRKEDADKGLDGQATMLSGADDATIMAPASDDGVASGVADAATIMASPGEDATLLQQPGAPTPAAPPAATAKGTVLPTRPDPTVVDRTATPTAGADEATPPKGKQKGKQKAKAPAPQAKAAPAKSEPPAKPQSAPRAQSKSPERAVAATVSEAAKPKAQRSMALPIAAAAIVVLAIAAYLLWPSGSPTPVAPADGTLRVNAAVGAVVSVESAEDGPLDLDPPDDACPGMACPPFAVALPAGEYLVRWRRTADANDAWTEPQRVTVRGGEAVDIFWAQTPPATLLDSGIE